MVPNPWVALEARPDLLLVRAAIPEPGRYYDAERTIVVRKGLMIVEERRYLWHELVHADRRDQACHITAKQEASVEREAARRAMPLTSLEFAAERALSWDEFADHLKAPTSWARFRWRIAHPAEKAVVRAAAREGVFA